MASSKVDRLFGRFVESRDPRFLARVFDRTAPELLRVAQYLTGSADQAEDLVQSCFLKAIEGAKDYDLERPLLPWLLGILANQVRTLTKAERRREARVPSPRPEPEDPAELAERRELMEILTKAQDSLPDPYRQVLELHLQHGLSAAEIASVLRRPPGTVRTQIVRGMEQLRRGLPKSIIAGSFGVATISSRGLAAVRSHVLTHATQASVHLSSTVALAAGAMIMKKSTTLVCAALLLVAGVGMPLFFLVGGFDTGTETGIGILGEVTASDKGTDVPSLPDGIAGKKKQAPDPDSERHPMAPPKEELGSLRVRAMWKDGSPAVGCLVVLHYRNTAISFRGGRTDELGECLFSHLRPGHHRFRIAVRPVRCPGVEIIAGEEVTVERRFERGAFADGLVVDQENKPVAGASIWVEDTFAFDFGWDVAESDDHGRFRIPILSDQSLAARKAGYAPSYSIRPARRLKKGETFKVTLRLRGPGVPSRESSWIRRAAQSGAPPSRLANCPPRWSVRCLESRP